VSGEVWIDIRKKFFTKSVVRHWNRLPWGAVESPSLGVFQRRRDAEVRDVI